MQILAISGSLQTSSGNQELLRTAQRLAPAGVEIILFDGLRALPHFDPDLENPAAPAAVTAWRGALQACDAVLIASPEYGHSLPGSLKNAIDWVIGSGELYEKVVAITAAVPHPERGRLGLKALRDTLDAVSAAIVGGEPIARGDFFEPRISELLSAIVQRRARAPDA